MKLNHKRTELIVKYKALTFKDSLAYFNDKLFTGGAFVFDGDIITQRLGYENGKATGEYNCMFIESDLNQHYDGEGVEDDPPEFYLTLSHDKQTGLFYRFDKDICWEIIEIVKFQSTGQLVNYFDNGELRELWRHEKNNKLHQSFNRYENGLYQSYGIIARDGSNNVAQVKLRFSELGKLDGINLKGDVFSLLDNSAATLFYPDFTTLASIYPIEISEHLCFSGKGLKDDFVKALFYRKATQHIKRVFLNDAGITARSLKVLLSFTNLERLDVSNGLISISDWQLFKQQRPNCQVIVDHVKL